MSSKIDVRQLIRYHISTLRDHGADNLNIVDIITFYILPFLIAAFLAYIKVDYSKDVIGIFVTIGALFTGLLLNLLVLVYDQKTKLAEKRIDESLLSKETISNRNTALEELYYNITYATLLSMVFVVVSVIKILYTAAPIPIQIVNFHRCLDVANYIIAPIVSAVGIHVMLTVTMIIKRVFSLLST